MKRLTKHIEITLEVAEYIESLHAAAGNDRFADVTDLTWQREHSFLQIPLSEAKFLSLFVKALKPKQVLEVGTFRGWSAAWIAKELPHDGKLVTIDHDVRIEAESRELWQKLRLESKIDFRIEKAIKALKDFDEKGEKFDLIFIDAGKAEYKEYLDLTYPLLNEGGVLLIDNTLWAGHTAEDTEEPRASNMKKFNEYVFEKFGDSACLIPAWDGVVMIVKD